MDLKHLVSFGDHVPLSKFKPEDTISSLAFTSDGQFLASGDQAGRVVIFRLNPNPAKTWKPSVSFVTQVHAHKSKFDYFRSELSEMKVVSLKWVPRQCFNPLLMTCNSHDVKLWRFNQTNCKINWEKDSSRVFPYPKDMTVKYVPECINSFTDIQTEYIVDLQCLHDQHSFLMVDYMCVKLWDMERNVNSISVYKVGQNDPEIVTSALHPTSPSTFLVADDGGDVRILDMREQAEDLAPAMTIRTAGHATNFASGTDSIGSAVWSNDENIFAVRRFGDVQVWDVRNTNAPVKSLDVQWFPGQMGYLCNEELVKDPFKTTFTPDGRIVTGCYSADFISWDWKNDKVVKHRAVSAKSRDPPPELGRDFTKRVTVCEAHPKENIVSVVSTAALFLFYEDKE